MPKVTVRWKNGDLTEDFYLSRFQAEDVVANYRRNPDVASAEVTEEEEADGNADRP